MGSCRQRTYVMKKMILGGLLVSLAMTGAAVAQAGLTTDGDSANFGVHALRAGFTPDPKEVTVTSGGSLDAGSMSLGSGCRGHVTAQPDAIVRWSGTSSNLRIGFRANTAGEDTTIIVRDPRGRYHCHDDVSSDNRNPIVDIASPRAGRYRVWVGSYSSGENVSGKLLITELSSLVP